MGLFSRKKKEPEPTEEDLLKELEEETKALGALPPMPPMRPGEERPQTPAQPFYGQPPQQKPPEKPALTEKEVSKLPLFMKVEEYDRIVAELNTVVSSMKIMEDTLNKLSQLEHEESETTGRWKEQLDLTKEQLRKLLAAMPETGRLRSLMEEKKRTKQKVQIKKEVESLKKELAKAQVPKKEVDTQVTKDVQNLRDSLKGLRDEMNHLHLELKMLNSLTQLKSSKTVQEIKETAQAAVQKPEYKKETGKRPW